MAATAGYRPASGPWRISPAWKCQSDLFDAALRLGCRSTGSGTARVPTTLAAHAFSRTRRSSCLRRGLTRQWRQVAGANRRLQLDVRAEALRGELASDARLFETTERAGDVDVVHVDAEGAGTNRFGDLQAVGGVRGPGPSAQALLAFLDHAHRVAPVAPL